MSGAHVLILGGTADARQLAAELTGTRGDLPTTARVTSSLAGRVAQPRLPAGQVRVGGFGGVAGLVDWLRLHGVTAVVDATHPFAAVMSRHAAAASALTGVPLLALRRPAWTPQPGDRWHEVDSLDEAAALLPELGRRVFLTTGRTELAPFRAAPRLWYLIRSVDAPPAADCPPLHQVLLDRGPFTLDGEQAVIREHRLEVLVTKNSGGTATAPKLLAARAAGLPVVMLRRPTPPGNVPAVSTPAAAANWLWKSLR